MKRCFEDSLPYIRDEYTHAQFDPSTGLPADELKKELQAFEAGHMDLPLPLRFSGMFRILMERCQLEINPYTPFAGKFNHGVDYQPDNAGNGIYEQVVREHYVRALSTNAAWAWKAGADARACGATSPELDVWHICPDWQRLFRLGFAGIRAELAESLAGYEAAGTLTEEQRVFYLAALEEYDAALHLMDRLRRAAADKGVTDYADALAQLLVGPPQTFYQILVLSRFYLNVQETGRERVRTYGLVDLWWHPYYQADLESGRLTQEEADDLIRYFLMQTAAEQRFADQPLCLGAVRPDGSEGNTDFAMRILDLYDGLSIHNPKLHIRCSKNVNRDFLRKVLDMVRRGHNSLVLINDETVYAGYERIGISREMSRTYLPTGCYEPCIPGIEDPRICSSWTNLSKSAELALTGGENIRLDTPAFGAATPKELPTFEDYMNAFDTQLRHMITFNCDVLDELYAHQQEAYAAPLLSGTIDSCARAGRDMFADGMEIRNLSLKCFGIGTAVDCVLAVKQLVYEEQRVTLPELVDILRQNWEGHESLRRRILASRRKWGNNVPEADQLAKHIYDVVWDVICDRPTPNGGRYRIGCDSVAQANYGHQMGATPDGRLAGTLLSKNMRPTNGMEREGLTALIQSVASLDASRFVDAAPLDFWLHPTAVSGEDGLDAFEGLIRTFFLLGGFAIHGNVLNTETLLEAQRDPEKHQNLQIRVCGWNEYFVRLSKELQDDFIARSQGIESA